MAMATATEAPVDIATEDHLLRDRRVATTIEEAHQQQRSKEVESQLGVKVLVHHPRMATLFLRSQTLSPRGQSRQEAVASPLPCPPAVQMSTHTFHHIKVDRATTIDGLHLATETETGTCTTEAGEEIAATQIAHATTIRTLLHHASTVMQTLRVVAQGLLPETRTETADILLVMRAGELGVEVRTEHAVRGCRIESVISIGDDCLRSQT